MDSRNCARNTATEENFTSTEMFTKEDNIQMASLGIDPGTAAEQAARLSKGIPWLEIAAPATPDNGIKVLSEAEAEEFVCHFPKGRR